MISQIDRQTDSLGLSAAAVFGNKGKRLCPGQLCRAQGLFAC